MGHNSKPPPPNPELDTATKRTMHKAIKLRARGKALEEDAKLANDEAKATLLPLMAAYDITTYGLDGVGRVSHRTSKGSAINATILREQMLLAGVDPKVIGKVIRKSTKSWATEYVEFKPQLSA